MATATKKEGEKYIEAVGRRKEASARARLTPGTKMSATINGKDINQYFQTEPLRMTALEALLKTTMPFTVTIIVNGGGIYGQAVAVRHAISRALIDYDINLRGALKKDGFLKRDPRAKERRKFGLKKARKAAQWSKR
jgi:small subunit ribosomal protein S9